MLNMDEKDKLEKVLEEEKLKEKEQSSETVEDEVRHLKQKQIENFWKKVGKMRCNNNPEGQKTLNEYLVGLKDGTWNNSIDFAAFKLGIDYKADLGSGDTAKVIWKEIK